MTVLFGAASWLVAPKAQAWGDEGHRVVGELAFRRLSPAAQASVKEALTDPGYATLAEAATWADTYARRVPGFEAFKPFHYVNVDARAPRYERQRDCPNGCIVPMLEQLIALLEDRAEPLSLSQRRSAIYWTAHLFGDIHQPLHVAHPDGKGGTATWLSFLDQNGKRSAHWIWDFGLIDAHAARGQKADDVPTYRRLADELEPFITPAKARRWLRISTPEALADETLVVSRRHAYLEDGDRIGARYAEQRWPIVAEQLEKAGVRLAAVLQHALGTGPAAAHAAIE